jgi:hypothetical protein
MYTDEDIIDLYEDLLDIGLAQTPEEEAIRAGSLLKFGITMGQASQILSDNRIPHTFYTTLWTDTEVNYRTNRILVRGLTVFYENGGETGPTITIHSAEGLKEAIQEINWILISEAHYTEASLLPEAGPLPEACHSAASESDLP